MVAQSLLYQRIETLVREARQAEEGRDHPRAGSLYSELAQWEEQYAERYVNDPRAKSVWQERVKNHRVRSDQLRHGVPTTEDRSGASSPVDTAVKGDAAALLAVIDGLVVKESPVRWDDIAGLEDAKQDVKLAFALAMARAPEGVRLPTWERILLYGPPGTGKTLLASAVAGSIPGCTFFNAQWSQLSSKWYGETPKTISLLYQRAREKAPSVVFLDEADYIAASRDESGRHEASIAALNTLLEELSGLTDKVERRFVFTFAAPFILVALVVVIVFGQSTTIVIALLIVFSWNSFARQVRGETLQLKEMDYVALAKVAGASTPRVLFHHILPGVFNTVLVLASLRVGSLIITESVLSFLGVGIPPPTPAWGLMIAEGRGYINTAWWITFFPGVAILLVVLAFNFLGDWLRDRLDPRLRQVD